MRKENQMGKNLATKILEAHLVEGELVPGREIAIRIDHTLLAGCHRNHGHAGVHGDGGAARQGGTGGAVHRPQPAADRQQECRRPRLSDDCGAEVRHPSVQAGQRRVPPGAPGALRRAGEDDAGCRFPHAHGRRAGDAGHRCRRARCGPGHGRPSLPPSLSEDHGG